VTNGTNSDGDLMPWTTKLLVIANRTVDSPELLDALRARAAEGPIHVTLVAPADTERSQIERRLATAVESLQADGIPVQGAVGHCEPIVAVREVWDPRRFDEVIVATLPTGASRWMTFDLPQRVARVTDAKVTRVVASAGARARIQRAPA
jgi:hypothetical protein